MLYVTNSFQLVMGNLQSTQVRKAGDVLYDVYVVVGDVQGAKFLQRLKVFQLAYDILVKEQAAQVSLSIQILNALEPIAFQPETFQTCVLL